MIDPGRVSNLVGQPPSWRFPTLLWFAATVVDKRGGARQLGHAGRITTQGWW